MRRILFIGVVILVFAITVVGVAVPEEYVEEVGVGDATGLFILNVPDASQPPSNTLHFHSVDNWCAPLAVANSIVFLDLVMEFDWAHGVTGGGIEVWDLSEYLGYFMATNGEGSPDRENARYHSSGTLRKDIPPGVMEYARWDRDNLYETPPPEFIEKRGLDWHSELVEGNAWEEPLDFLLGSIEEQIPPVACFTYWNPVIIEKEEVEIGSEKVLLSFAEWGEHLSSTQVLHKENPKVPIEEWNEKEGIGHAVTVVGFIKGDPDGARGPLPNTLWVIVHDNWVSTPENIVIPWDHLAGVVVFAPR